MPEQAEWRGWRGNLWLTPAPEGELSYCRLQSLGQSILAQFKTQISNQSSDKQQKKQL